MEAEETVQDPENGVVTLRNSSRLQADLIIAVDGVHSRAVEAVSAQPNPATPTNISAYRFLLHTEAIKDDLDIYNLIHDGGSMKSFVEDTGKRIVWYPCRR